MDRRRGARRFSAFALASTMVLLLHAAPSGPATQIVRAAPSAVDGPNIEGLSTFDVYYGLRKTVLEDGEVPAPFTAVRHEPFIGRWQTASVMVLIWVEGAHTESRLLYFIAENAEGMRREFEGSESKQDVSERLAVLGLPYRATCNTNTIRSAFPGDPTRAVASCWALVDRVLASAGTMDAGQDESTISTDDAFNLMVTSLLHLRAAADAVRGGLHAPTPEQSLSDAKKLYDALRDTPIEPSELPSGITRVKVGVGTSDIGPQAPGAFRPEGELNIRVNGDEQGETVDDQYDFITYWVHPAPFAESHENTISQLRASRNGSSYPTDFGYPVSCGTYDENAGVGITYCEAEDDAVTVGVKSERITDTKHGDDVLAAAMLRLGIAHLERVKAQARGLPIRWGVLAGGLR